MIMKSSQTFVYTALTITRWRKLELLICSQYLPPHPSPLKQQLLTSYHDTSQLCNVHITSDLGSMLAMFYQYHCSDESQCQEVRPVVEQEPGDSTTGQ